MILIQEILLAFVVVCLCVCLGQAVRRRYQLLLADALIIGEMILIGLAETAHLGAVVSGQSFSRCIRFFLLLLGIALAAAVVFFAVQQRQDRKQRGQSSAEEARTLQKQQLQKSQRLEKLQTQQSQRSQRLEKLQTQQSQKAQRLEKLSRQQSKESQKLQKTQKSENRKKLQRPQSRTEWFFSLLFAVLLLLQLITVVQNSGSFPQRDMTVETVGSFLQTDGLYTVNPMTGQPFTAGMPFRLKLLCLPTLYGILCRLSGLQPQQVVTVTVPVLTFFSCYAAFGCVAQGLFPKNRKKRICFLILVILVMWAGSYLYGMDGFNLLFCGYRGVTVRNLVLLPYLISLVIRKKWQPVLLCILAEVCIVWTFYGLGACVLVWAGLTLAGSRKKSL